MLSGCSSSNNAGGGTGGPETRFGSVVQQSAGVASQEKIAGAAKATALSTSGSVVQSSLTTINDITATAKYNEDGTITYVVSSAAGGWTFNSGDPGEGVTVLSSRKAEGWNAISLLLETDAGRRWVDVFTDIEPPTGDTPTPDTDYLSGGIWVFVPKPATETGRYEFGVFVYGSDPFESGNVAALTGSAKYEGGASGLYSDPDADSNSFFSAMSELTADFEDDMIDGRIFSFIINGQEIEDLELMLVETGLGTGFFSGATSATYGDGEFTGRWGGRFYGNGATANDKPGSVAGTFGAADDDDRSFIGVFGAHRQAGN